MLSLRRVTDGFKDFVRRNASVRWFDRPLGEPGVLTLILIFRFIVSLGLVLRFALNRRVYSDDAFLVVRISLLGFFAYFCLLLFARSFARDAFLSYRGVWLQVVSDVVVFSFIYFLTRDVRSELFVLYFLPLLIAAEYFSLAETLGALTLTSMSFAMAVAAIDLWFTVDCPHWIWRVFFPRLFFLFTFVAAVLYRRRFRVSPDLMRQQETLASRLEHAEDGIYVIDEEYQLLYVSEILRQRHGDNIHGGKCFFFFARGDAPCQGCPCAHIREAQESNEITSVIQQVRVDRNGQNYLAEIALSAVPPESDGPVIFVGRVMDSS